MLYLTQVLIPGPRSNDFIFTFHHCRLIQLGYLVLYNSLLWLLFLSFGIKNLSHFKLSQKPCRIVNKSSRHNSSRDSWWQEHQGEASFSLACAVVMDNTYKFLQSPFPFPCSGRHAECYHFLHFDCSKLETSRIKTTWPSFMICSTEWKQIPLQVTRDNVEIPDSSLEGVTLPSNSKHGPHRNKSSFR